MAKLIESFHYIKTNKTVEVWQEMVDDGVRTCYVYNAGNYWKLFKTLENLMTYLNGEGETGYYELTRKEYNTLEKGLSNFFK